MKLRRIEDDRVRIFSIPGEGEKIIYGSTIDKDGTVKLKEKGKEDLYGYIQSFAESVDINVVLSKYCNGDLNALNKVQGTYLDTTQFPTTYADVLNTINAATEAFDRLPADVRKKFDNDVNKYIATLGSDEWLEKANMAPKVNEVPSELEPVKESVFDEQIEEVKTNE